MSATVELVRANERYARLRAAVEAVADRWDGSSILYAGFIVDDLRALLAAVDS